MSMSTFIFIGHFLFLFQNMCIFFIAHIISSECFFAPFMKGGCGDFFLVISNECEKSTDSDFRTPLIPLTKGDYFDVISNEREKSTFSVCHPEARPKDINTQQIRFFGRYALSEWHTQCHFERMREIYIIQKKDLRTTSKVKFYDLFTFRQPILCVFFICFCMKPHRSV